MIDEKISQKYLEKIKLFKLFLIQLSMKDLDFK